jgi:peptidoglycan/LPS O-acetylase OafA/YrhL
MTTTATLEIAQERAVSGLDRSRRLLPLDGVRGLAILAVFLFHYGRGASQSPVAWVRGLSGFVGLGWSGVDLFFVLSGFLITGILYDTTADPGYYRKFYIRRILRIFPIYYIACAVLYFAGTTAGVHWTAGHLSFLLYLGYPAALIWPSLVQLTPFMPITHLWSLSAEEQFYMGWPWMIRRLGTGRNILAACAAIFGLALALRLACVNFGAPGWAYPFLLCRMDTLATGAALAIVVRKTGAARMQAWAAGALAVTALCFAALCASQHSVDRANPVISTWGYSLLALGYGAILVLSLGLLSGFFSSGILRFFGKYSYGLYLYHFPLTVVLEPLKMPIIQHLHSLAAGSVAYLAACLGVNLLVAGLSFRFIESPVLRLKSRFEYMTPAHGCGVQGGFNLGN